MHIAWRNVAFGDGSVISSSVTECETAELQHLASGRHVLEIGSAYGYSAVAMALGGAQHITAVDPHAEYDSASVMMANLHAYGVTGKVTMIMDTSDHALAELAGTQFGLVFIDGDHSAKQVKRDVQGSLEMLAPGGILACHDYDEDCQPDVRPVLDEIFPGGPLRLVDTLFVVKR
jgi:predicted O-methyltransferase YrrM